MPSHERVEVSHGRGPVRRRSHESSAEGPSKRPDHHLVRLQRSLGNAHVARLLARRDGLEDELVQTRRDMDSSHSSPEVGLEGGPISESLSNRIQSNRGGGSALDPGTRATMERSFGDSFDDVRIHTGSEADSLNRSVSARAFTTGSDIFFSQQASPNDTHLLAHELMHVVQQRGTGSASGPMTVGPAGDSHEIAANAAASSVASGGPVETAQRVEDSPAEHIGREAMPEEEELAM